MIVVRNTKELEQKYDLRRISDEETITVLGGLEGKAKYNKEKYQRRITYPARQLKQIIFEMKEIERTIPTNWNEWQKAKYIHETLANNIEYNYNEEDYSTQQSSNLSILLSKKGICAGYSLLYKEMMDRQGIECEYVRGKAITRSGKTGTHAWNMLTINGKSFGVDVTWEAGAKHRGEQGLQYFGDDARFLQTHIADADEKKINLVNYTKESIDSISTDNRKIKNEYTTEEKIDIINFAIAETYQKFKGMYNEEEVKRRVSKSVKDYIKDGRVTGFTRNNNAREQLIENITGEEMVGLLTRNYVMQNANEQINISPLKIAVTSNIEKYGYEQATSALEKYIRSGNAMSFTRQNNARGIIQSLSQEQTMDFMIQDIIDREIAKEEKTEIIKNANIQEMKKQYFSGDEFAKVALPKQKGLISKAMTWIKNRTKELYNNKVKDNTKVKEKNIDNEYQK